MAGLGGGSAVVGGSAAPASGWGSAVVRGVDLLLGRPALWPIALAGFLARGGFVLLLVPILPIPTAVGLANSLGPTVVTAAGLPPGTVVMLVVVGIATIAWFLIGGIVGALADIVLVEASSDGGAAAASRQPGVGKERTGTARLVARLVGIRIVALIPLAIAMVVTARPIFDALYRQLTAPSQVAEPLVARIVADAAGPFAVVAAGWFIGELLGGIAVRLAILADLSLGRAVIGSLGLVMRRPLTTLATAVLASAGILLALGPSLIASGVAWSRLHGLVAGGTDLTFALVSVIIVATWLATLVFASVGSAWRGLLWSTDVGRAVTARR